MPLVTPIDEGDPIWTSLTVGTDLQQNVSNVSAAALVQRSGQPPGATQEAMKIWFPVSGAIHDNTRFDIKQPVVAQSTLDIYNPVGYKLKVPSQIIQDLLVHQGHVPHMLLHRHAIPTHDQTTTSWTSSGGTFFGVLDEGTDIKPIVTSDRVFTTTPGAILVLLCSQTFPSNVTKIKEIRLNTWSALQVGTDTGINLEIKLYHSAVIGTPGSGTQFGPTGGNVVAHPTAASGNEIRFEQQLIQGLDLTPTQCEKIELDFKPLRETIGGTPDPEWWIYAFDLDFFCEVSDIDLVDEESMDAIDTYFSGQTPSYQLQGDFTDGHLDDAVMDILAHAPEVMLYLSNEGKLTTKKWPKYADETAPYKIGPAHDNFRGIRGTFDDDERLLTEAEYDYQIALPGAVKVTPGVADSDNLKGVSKLIDTLGKWRSRPTEEPGAKIREWLQVFGTIERYAIVNELIFGETINGLTIEVDHNIFRTQIGQIISVDVPDLGYDDQKHLIVGEEIDFDMMDGTLLVIDREYIEPT